MRTGSGVGLWQTEAGACPVCGQFRCNHYPPEPWDGRKRPVPPPVFIPQENVWREDRLVAAVNDPIPWARAVELGLVESDPPAKPKAQPKGKRAGSRAKRPTEDRAKKPAEDR